MSDCIPILVDQVASPAYRGMMPDAAGRALDVVVEVAGDVLRERLAGLTRLLSDAAAATPSDGPFEVAELRFTVHVNANGEVSVMSLAKGGVAAGAGIEVTLRRRGAA